MIKIKVFKQQMRKLPASSKTDGHCGLRAAIFNAKECLWLIGSIENCLQRNQCPNSNDEKVMRLFSPFWDRQADLVTYRGNCLHRILGRC